MDEFAVQLFQLAQVNKEAAAIIVVVALGAGTLLKQTPKVPNWAIPWVLAGLGVASGLAFVAPDPKGAAIGFGLAVFSNGIQSFFKNGVLRKTGDDSFFRPGGTA